MKNALLTCLAFLTLSAGLLACEGEDAPPPVESARRAAPRCGFDGGPWTELVCAPHACGVIHDECGNELCCTGGCPGRVCLPDDLP